MPLAEAGMATGFDDLDLPMLDKHLFTMLNLDVTLPAVGAHRSFGFKLRPSEHQHVFDVLEKFLQNLFQELDLVTSGGPDLQRDYLGVRDRAAASMDEWQGLVDDWKGSLLTRLGDLGNELTEVKKSETRLRQLLEQKEAELSEIREESRSLKKDLMRVRRRCSEERLEKLGLNDQGGSTPSTPSTSVIGFFAKTLGKGMSKFCVALWGRLVQEQHEDGFTTLHCCEGYAFNGLPRDPGDFARGSGRYPRHDVGG
ncbi:unnamed protein product [Durusdinium trenchii]